MDIPPRTSQLLRYDRGSTAKWQEEGGAEWDAYFFRWQGKTMHSIMNARYHRPEVCLAGSGCRQISESTVEFFNTGRLKLPFRKYIFSAQGQLLYVFFGLWQDGDEQRKGMRWNTQDDRLLMAIEGRRRYGQQTLEIIMRGYSGLPEAEQALRQRLPDLIRLEPHLKVSSSQRDPGANVSSAKRN